MPKAPVPSQTLDMLDQSVTVGDYLAVAVNGAYSAALALKVVVGFSPKKMLLMDPIPLDEDERHKHYRETYGGKASGYDFMNKKFVKVPKPDGYRDPE